MAGMRSEVQQQIELERGEVDRRAAKADLPLGRQDLEVAVAQRARLGAGVGLGGAQQVGAAVCAIARCTGLATITAPASMRSGSSPIT